MAAERVVLDGFRYEIEEGALWNSDKGVSTPCTIVHFVDDERGIHLETYFGADAWEKFRRDVAAGGPILSPDYVRGVGI